MKSKWCNKSKSSSWTQGWKCAAWIHLIPVITLFYLLPSRAAGSFQSHQQFHVKAVEASGFPFLFFRETPVKSWVLITKSSLIVLNAETFVSLSCALFLPWMPLSSEMIFFLSTDCFASPKIKQKCSYILWIASKYTEYVNVSKREFWIKI